jgi:hypothetical protein
MSAHDSNRDVENFSDEDNVVPFRRRAETTHRHVREMREVQTDRSGIDMRRYPVDIRGDVTFGRLLSGLATVGLTVRVDAQSGRVVITDETGK